jgi:hypothetical protein
VTTNGRSITTTTNRGTTAVQTRSCVAPKATSKPQ